MVPVWVSEKRLHYANAVLYGACCQRQPRCRTTFLRQFIRRKWNTQMCSFRRQNHCCACDVTSVLSLVGWWQPFNSNTLTAWADLPSDVASFVCCNASHVSTTTDKHAIKLCKYYKHTHTHCLTDGTCQQAKTQLSPPPPQFCLSGHHAIPSGEEEEGGGGVPSSGEKQKRRRSGSQYQSVEGNKFFRRRTGGLSTSHLCERERAPRRLLSRSSRFSRPALLRSVSAGLKSELTIFFHQLISNELIDHSCALTAYKLHFILKSMAKSTRSPAQKRANLYVLERPKKTKQKKSSTITKSNSQRLTDLLCGEKR